MPNRSNSVADLELELRSAGIDAWQSDIADLHAMWLENLPRRVSLRGHSPAPTSWLTDTTVPCQPNAKHLVRTHRLVDEDASLRWSGEIAHLTISELSGAIKHRAISCREVATGYLERIERLNGKTHAFITVLGEQALAAADALDDRLSRKEWLGPMHGVPIGLKDLIGIKDVRLTGGSALLSRNVSSVDAAVTTNLRQSGAVVLGTNTLNEFGLGPFIGQGELASGLNPWDPSKITAGSSSGSAVAVVAGLCAASCGTDTAGSVRLPAIYCGAVGLKPTNGLVDSAGVIPMCWSLDVVGPITRSVADARLMLGAMLGDGGTKRLGLHQASTFHLQGLRIGLLTHDFVDGHKLDEEVLALFWHAVDWLQSEGAKVRDVALENIDDNEIIYATHLAETYAVHRDALRSRPEGYHARTRLQLMLGGLVTADDWFRAGQLRIQLKRAFHDLMRNVDILVMPAQATGATPVGVTGAPALMYPRSRFTRPWNLVGAPAVTVTAGYDRRGLPLSLQFVSRCFEERLLLDVAGAYETRAAAARRTPPGF